MRSEGAKKKEIFYGSSFEAKDQMEKVVRDNEDKESIIKELSRKLQQSAQDEAGFKKEIQELQRKVTAAGAPPKVAAPVQVDNKVMEQLQAMAEKLHQQQEREETLLAELKQKDEIIKKKEEGIAELKSRYIALVETTKKRGKK